MAERKKRLKRVLKWMGPGFVTGASDDDPAGIGTYSQAGAQFGLGLLWTMPFTLPLMSSVQLMAAHLGRTSGHGIASNLRKQYPRPVAWAVVVLLVAANLFNLGADLAVMGAAAALILPGPAFAFTALFCVGAFVALALLRYRPYSRVLRILVVSLLAYVATAFVLEVDWGEALRRTVWPSFQMDAAFWGIVVAIFGTTISPYMFFWQSSHEVEQAKEDHEPPLKRNHQAQTRETERIRYDTLGGMTLSNVVAFFIILTCASALHDNGIRDIESASAAADALRPLAGDLAFTLFALGIIGTGLLAVPVLAGSAAIAVAELVGWPHSLDRRWSEQRRFYGLLGGFFAVGLAINLVGFNPIDALVWSAIINGIVAVPVLFFMLRLATNKKIMGALTLARPVRWLAGLTLAVMSVTVGGLAFTALR